ncbi:hypothetical protein SCLCIDRAFT_1224467 [Scleroderma citrinum Foug A]|uniref:Deacetylase sirtuin-type domain-containing protein n=1 Tax=Scleroderma citrinum Foug A TaxID=1036808 RepID=A0A0C2ZF11_9AGAM|nr:hypothetical protein SCLCIDRAFT_1224467 [Scleroderma citrinum Foug A]
MSTVSNHIPVFNNLQDPSTITTITRLRDALRVSKNIIVIAGAGLSAASGIPTFRDGGGLWRSLDATTLATPTAFTANPSLVWQFYHYQWVKALESKPNLAHHIIAKLSVPEFRREVAPNAKSFHLITQNVDRLSVRALQALESQVPANAPPSDRPQMDSVFEMHGRIFDIECTSCDYCVEDLSNPLCPALDVSHIKDYNDAGTKQIDIPLKELPRCSAYHALARPSVVWFGETPYQLSEINRLVVGTSSTVLPASLFASRVQKRGGKVAVFNFAPSAADGSADFVFRGPCETELGRVFPEPV